MGRGKYYSWWRKAGEGFEAAIYREGWAARAAFFSGLQGQLYIDRREFVLPHFFGDANAGNTAALRLVFASDLHAGPLTDSRLFDAMHDAIVAFEPHLVLFGGDYVSLHQRHVSSLAARLGHLRIPLGMYGVFGNHDLWLDNDFIERQLAAAGVQMLVNRSLRLPAPYHNISICGLDEPGTGVPDAVATFDAAAPRRLLLMHSPLGLKFVKDFSFDLAFCGHTHGGQIALPNGRPIVLPTGSGERRYASGYFHLPSGGQLLASRGVGMSDLPIRLFAQSEIHLCTIRAGA
ncbi:MAG: metallophosphoesterase [Pseudomonadota bacterium]